MQRCGVFERDESGVFLLHGIVSVGCRLLSRRLATVSFLIKTMYPVGVSQASL